MDSPLTLEAGLARAIELYNAGRGAQAEATCRQALDRHGPHPALDQLLAVLCHERGDSGAASLHVERSLKARPAHVPTLIVAALVRQDVHDLAGAAQALQAVLQQQHDHVAARVNLGVVRLEQGRLEEALDEFGLAYALRPQAYGRIANALTSAPTGALWLDPQRLRATLQQRGQRAAAPPSKP